MRSLRTEEIALLIKKKLEGVITTDENNLLQEWADSKVENSRFLDSILADDTVFKQSLHFVELEKSDRYPWENRLIDLTFRKIKADKNDQRAIRYKFRRFIPYVAAAVVLTFISINYLFKDSLTLFKQEDIARTIQVMPKEAKVFLTLDNGKVISLNPHKKGIQMMSSLTYLDGSPIENIPSDYNFLQVKVPNSGEFKIVLEDGSNVWLNAASTLKFPKHFMGHERKVELEGEGYFEIAKVLHTENGKRANMPFLVKTNRQTVNVLGTIFNVMSYDNEPYEKTTLIEGAVMIASGEQKIKLYPGEQGVVASNSKLEKQPVYVEDFMGWRNNKFIFNNTDLHQTARMLNRWYDVEVILDKEIPEMHFYGEIDRNKNLGAVLKILEKSNLKFKLTNDKKLLVAYDKR